MREPLTAEEHKITINLNLSKDDAEFLKSIFLGFDLNGDGKISKEELTSIMRGLQSGKEPTEDQIRGFSYFLNGNFENVSFKNFLEWNSFSFQKNKEDRRQAQFFLFSFATRTDNKTLSREEFNHILDY